MAYPATKGYYASRDIYDVVICNSMTKGFYMIFMEDDKRKVQQDAPFSTDAAYFCNGKSCECGTSNTSSHTWYDKLEKERIMKGTGVNIIHWCSRKLEIQHGLLIGPLQDECGMVLDYFGTNELRERTMQLAWKMGTGTSTQSHLASPWK